MNPAVGLCEHLASDSLAALAVAPDDVLEWQDGPIVAVVRCPICGGAGLLEMLDWSDDQRLRVHALAGLDPAAFALFRRNAERGSCDLARRERELESLVASSGPPQRLVAREAIAGGVVRSTAWPDGVAPPADTWQERVSRARDPGWFARLGLARG